MMVAAEGSTIDRDMDVHDKATRSYNMSRIRSRDTGPELRLRRLLWASGMRGYRLHKALPGKPDLVFSRARVAVFIDGCFWHGCPECGDGRAPSSNTGYWSSKREMNQERDRRRTHELEELGWTVLRLWEHRVTKDTAKCVSEISRAVRRVKRRAN
jgi:DNA mismatch endonuclease, patch repair protein